SDVEVLLGTNNLIIVTDRGPCWTLKYCRQRLSYATRLENRIADPYIYDLETERILREVRGSDEAKKLYDLFRRTNGRQFLNAGFIPSPLETDFARSYLEWWVAKNILIGQIDKCVMAYPPHSPFDLVVYYMLRWKG